jgi:restriction endonuclease Mrr
MLIVFGEAITPFFLFLGILVTPSSLNPQAREYLVPSKINWVIIECTELLEYMIDYYLGVSTINTFSIKKLNTDYLPTYEFRIMS